MPCRSPADASRRWSRSGKCRSIDVLRRYFQYPRAGRRSTGSAAINSVSSAFIRRITCTLDAPYEQISSKARRRKSSQLGSGMTTRATPPASHIGAVARQLCPRRRRRSPISSRAWTAVVGSLIAGDSARIAMSTSSRIAYCRSCSNVRWSPTWRQSRADPVPP